MKATGAFLLGAILLPSVATAASYYRSIDRENVPVWDEYVPVSDGDYSDKYKTTDMAPGEWQWWNVADNPQPSKEPEVFWDPEVDYETFEEYTIRENLDNKKLILSDIRSCPYNDTVRCKEWLAYPHPVGFLPESKGYVPVLRDKTLVESEVEELLKAKKTRQTQKSKSTAVDQTFDVWADSFDFGECPFETEKECQIWKDKPTVPEAIANRIPMVSSTIVNSLIALSRAGNEITTDMADAKPLVDRYRALMVSSRACCSSGLMYNLRSAGASNGLVYKFMVDDANFYQFSERCLMITDDELDEFYAGTSTAEVVADVRNTCLCRKKDYFVSLLSPFVQVADANPAFANAEFNWQYTDGLKRTITVSINRDVNAVLNQLSNCPD